MVSIYKPKKGRSKGKAQSNQLPLVSLKIDSLDHHGQGVASNHDPVVFVEGGLPGELCEVQVTRQKPRFWHGKVKKVKQLSELRQTPFCPQYQLCGGCQHQHLDSQALIEYKQQAVNMLLQKQGIKVEEQWQPPLLNPQRRYRRKTRLALDARNKKAVVLGYRSKGSSKVVPINACPLLEPELDALLPPLQSVIRAMKSASAVGHISMLKGENKLQLCLRITRPLPEQDKRLLQVFASSHACELVLEDSRGQFECLSTDSAALYFTPDGKHQLYLQPNDFVQVNDRLNQLMVAQAIDWLNIKAGDKVLDLFCGTGNFSIPMASRCQALLGVEGVKDMVQRAQQNALKNDIHNTTFVHSDLSEDKALAAFKEFQPDKILLDPSREGAFALMAQLAASGAAQIVYVSCNPASFARDAAVLMDNGYDLKQTCLMDMFTYTAHTEMMSSFVLRDSR